MTALAIPRRADTRSSVGVATRNHAVPLLQAFALLLWLVQSDYVIRPLGNLGYPAGLIGTLAFVLWLGATLMGIHNPREHRHPMRMSLSLFWLVTFGSYMSIDRSVMTSAQLLAADRWLMQLALISGVALVAAECLTTMRDIHRVLRAMVWGTAFSGVIGALQYWASMSSIADWGKYLPGFTLDGSDPAIVLRNGLNRVTGTAIDPIELGVTASMVLPIAIYLAIYDTDRSRTKRWLPVALIGVAIMVSVSRSAIIGVAISCGFLIVMMPARQRLVALCLLPVALAGVFMTAHGLLGTLVTFFGYGASDPTGSISHRTNNYPYVWSLVQQHPLLGQGGGTYLADPGLLHVLDNQYLDTVIELGILGLVAFLVLFATPVFAALSARKRTADPALRLLIAALAGASATALVDSVTFDSFSFPCFYCTFALIMGLVGACWCLTHQQAPSVRHEANPQQTAELAPTGGA